MKNFIRIFVTIILIFGIFVSANAQGIFKNKGTQDQNFKISGKNNNLIFGLDGILDKSIEFKIPTLSSNIEKFLNGSFWIKEIGPVKMENLKIDCVMSTSCAIVGNAKSQTIGEVDFRDGKYDSTTGKFFGKIGTNIGKFSLDGIYIIPDFDIKNHTIKANNNATIELTKNFGNKIIELRITGGMTYIGSGKFIKNIDLSRAGTKKISIEIDGTRKIFDIEVIPSEISEIKMETAGSKIAGDEQIIIFKPQDKYGNPIKKGKIKAKFKSNVAGNQTDLDLGNDEFNGKNVVFSRKSIINNFGIADINSLGEAKFAIKSLPPTDENNKIFLQNLSFINSENREISTNLKTGESFVSKIDEKTKNIVFENPLEIKVSHDELYLNQDFSLNFELSKKTQKPKNIKIFTEFEVLNNPKTKINLIEGNPTNKNYKNLQKNNTIWIETDFENSDGQKEISVIFDDSLKPKPKSQTQVNIFAQYELENDRFETKTITTKIQTIDGIGENEENLLQLDANSAKNQKNQIWNLVRKNVSYLRRNTEDFSDKDYLIKEGDISLENNLDKETYVSIGGDIIIRENIFAEKAKAFIAIEKNGIGGKIKIAENVTNLEKVVLLADELDNFEDENKNKQLYIFGSVFVNNSCMDARDPDCLPSLRKNYKFNKTDNSNMAIGEIAKKYKHSPIIINYNPEISTNPPIGFAEIMK